MNLVWKIMQHNWWTILWFNFRMLPIRQAIHLPFDFYHKVRFDSKRGKVILNTDKLYRGIVKIGGRGSDIFPRKETVLSLDGEIIFAGQTEIGNGASVVVKKGGTVTFGDRVRLGANTKLYCTDAITFGNEIDVSWESQVFDTDFHHMLDTITSQQSAISSPVHIGSYNWIGNRCNIMKGSRLPDHTIVASGSLINKDYTLICKESSMLAGQPAKVVKQNIARVFEQE